MKKIKKYYKWVVLTLVFIIISVLMTLIYINVFKTGTSERLDGIEDYEITKEEVKLVKESLKEIPNIGEVEIHTNYKIVKIFLELKENTKFKEVKEKIHKSLENFSSDNLSFYDIEIFVECLDEESEIYPKIGYKHKYDSEITWNR